MDKRMFERVNVRSKGHDKILRELSVYIEDLIERKNNLKDKLDNYSKADEIKRLEDKIQFYISNSIHIMSDKESIDAKTFSTEHYESCKSNIQYILEGTGIGTAVSVKCKKCGAVKNVTDFESW